MARDPRYRNLSDAQYQSLRRRAAMVAHRRMMMAGSGASEGGGGGGGGITDPSDITNLLVWYEAELDTGYTDGQAISGGVPDHSGNSNDGTNANPVEWIESATPGGLAAYQFTEGSNDDIDIDVAVNIADATTFVLFQQTADITDQAWVFYARGGTNQRWYAPIAESSGLDIFVGGSTRYELQATTVINTWYYVTVRADGTAKEAWLDGTSVLTFTDSNTGSATDTRLTDPDFGGQVALFLQYDRALTDQEVSDVHDWISSRFL